MAADSEFVTGQHPQRLPDALSAVSERIDALEGHMAQLLIRQQQERVVPEGDDQVDSASDPGRVVRPDLHFDDDDRDGFDERFTAFTASTDVDERSRNWLLG
jgi:hypothetical protein